MEGESRVVNRMLVSLFHDVLRIEEQTLHTGAHDDLSMREIHVVEAVCAAGDQNTMTALAARLHVTTGSLTVAVAALCRKGYLLRDRSTIDRRLVHIQPTEKGSLVAKAHEAFHDQMAQAVLECLEPDELPVFLKALRGITTYFESKESPKA